MKLISCWLLSIGFLLINPLIVKAEYIKAKTCVNMRHESSVNSTIVTCLASGTYVEIVRRSTKSGALTWAEDNKGRAWYLIKLPNQSIKGWVVAEYVDF